MEKGFLFKVIGRLGGDKQDVRDLRVLNRFLSWKNRGFCSANWSWTCVDSAHQRKDGTGDGDENLLDEAEAHSFRSTAAPRAGPTRSSVRNQRVVQKHVVTDESRHKRTPPSVRVFVSSSPLGVQVPVATRGESECVLGHGFRGVFGHSAEHLGGAAMSGSQLIKHWNSTQKAVTLSPAEAELCGIVKCTTESLGIQSVGRDLGLSMALSIPTRQQQSESVREQVLGGSEISLSRNYGSKKRLPTVQSPR